VTIELLKPRLDPEFRSLIPPLTAEERDQLERNIRDFGRARDPLVCWQGLLLDGHNRYEICETFALPYTVTEASCATRDEAKVWIIRNQFGRRNLQPFQRVELALKLEPLIASKAKENQRASGGAVPQKSAEPVETRKEIAKAAGVSHDTITKGKVISQKAPEAVKEQLRRGEISINSAYQDIRGSERRIERVERIQAVTAQNTALESDRPVPILYADPPWRYEHVKTDNRAIENQYPTMSLEDICALPVRDVATPDAVLFMWATSPKLAEAMRVLEAWGFVYRTSMVWVKDKIGMGYYARQQHELLLIATKGEPPVPLPENRPASVVTADRGEHSQKPTVFYELIERMYPEFDKKELFLRGVAREGWTGWGNQAA